MRWKNVAGTADYIERVMRGDDPIAERRILLPAQRLEEALFTGLRLVDGVDLEHISARYGVDVWATYGDELRPFVEAGWLIHDGVRLRLTRAGMLMANEVMAVFV